MDSGPSYSCSNKHNIRHIMKNPSHYGSSRGGVIMDEKRIEELIQEKKYVTLKENWKI